MLGVANWIIASRSVISIKNDVDESTHFDLFFSKIKEALKYMNTFQMYVLFLDSIEAYKL